MRKILALTAILALVSVPAVAASMTGFDQWTVTGNCTKTSTTATTGFYNGGAIIYSGLHSSNFIVSFTIQAHHITGGFSIGINWLMDPTTIGPLWNGPGYQALIAYGTSSADYSGQTLVSYGPGGNYIAGQSLNPGPAMFSNVAGNPEPYYNTDGPSADYVFACVYGTTTITANGIVIAQCATPATGQYGLGFMGDGTYTVSNLSFVPAEPTTVISLLSGFVGVGILTIRRRRAG